MRHARLQKLSKVPTQDALLFISYSMAEVSELNPIQLAVVDESRHCKFRAAPYRLIDLKLQIHISVDISMSTSIRLRA